MAAAHIDRLTLEIPDMSAAEARDLALRVAAGLAETHTLPAAGDIPALAIELVADPRSGLSLLADRILAELIRQLDQA
jgi:hypothetical protein